MAEIRKIHKVWRSVPTVEGAGVHLHRAFGFDEVPLFDPFLLLDDRRHTSNSLDYLKATGYRGSALYVERPAVTDRNLITASGAAAWEFAYEILSRLGLYSAQVLEAWYGLFKTGHPAYYSALLRAGGGAVEHDER